MILTWFLVPILALILLLVGPLLRELLRGSDPGVLLRRRRGISQRWFPPHPFDHEPRSRRAHGRR